MRRFLPLLLAISLAASAGTPPVVDAAAQMEAARIASLSDADPAARIRMMLDARGLSDAALFALAATHPGVVEQLTDDRYRLAIDYLAQLPPPELHRIRQGETVLRTVESMGKREYELAEALCEELDIKPKKFQALRAGPLEGRIYRVDLVAKARKKQTITRTIELGWPSTPARDEESREALSRHFGARPSQQSIGAGAPLPLEDGSFEAENTLGTTWILRDAVSLGPPIPVSEVQIDPRQAIDGLSSIRFYGDEKTRLFRAATQQVSVVPGMKLRARAQIRAEGLRVEFQQRPTDVYLGLSFLDIYGNPVAPTRRATARLASYPWELLEIVAEVPYGADLVQVELLSAVSGTAWFDGVTLEIAP